MLFFSSRRRHTRCAVVTGVQTCALPILLVSRTRPAAEAVHVAERMGAELIAMGSAGAQAMAVVRGEADIYLHPGGQYEWDNCAPAAVAAAACLHVWRIARSPLPYNHENPYLPHMLNCRPKPEEQAPTLAPPHRANPCASPPLAPAH